MAVQTAAGSKIYIGTTTPASTQEDYEEDSFTEIGEVESIGEFGDQANEITFTSLNDRRVRKFKGSFNAGTIQMVVGRDPSNAGQADIVEAMASDEDFNFKVTLNDAPDSGANPAPTTFYFRGKVMSYTANIGDAENVVRSSIAIGINSEILEIPATAGS